MKRKFMYLMATAIIAVGFVGCTNENDPATDGGDGGGTVVEGVDTYAKMTIINPTPTGTRGATDTETPTAAEESNLKLTAMKMVVFKDGVDGSYDTHHNSLTFAASATPGEYVCESIKLKSGAKFIYVFSDPQGLIDLSTVTVATTRKQFEKTLLAASNVFDTATDNPIKIASAANGGEFLIGTLWGVKVNVPTGGTETAAIDLGTKLEMGRAASKVKLVSVSKGANSPLKGDLGTGNDAPIYRLLSVPKKIYAVGQWSESGSVPGTVNAHGQAVTSAVHNSNADADYLNYPWNAAKKEATTYYAVENTADNFLKRNNTLIQLQVVYKPIAAEIFELNAQKQPENGATLPANGTFYRYLVTNATDGSVKYYIFNGQLTQSGSDPVIDPTWGSVDLTSEQEFVNGKMYYDFPIRDKNEPVSQQLRVLRNHSYDVTVSSISNFGNPTDFVDPDDEIDTETYVDVTINVIPWSKVIQDQPL